MEASELRTIVGEALRDPRNFPWPIYLAVAALSLIFGYLGSFLGQRGKNQADKGDLRELTSIVENVRTDHAKQLENVRADHMKQMEMLAHSNRRFLELGSREHQLRLAALDRRLETHQEAYTLWKLLAQSVHSADTGQAAHECQMWWDKNCLYLDEVARSAFADAIIAARGHRDLLSTKYRTPEVKEAVQRSWRTIMVAGEALVRGVELPPIGNPIAEEMPQPEEKSG